MGKARLQAYHAKRDRALSVERRKRIGTSRVSGPAAFGGATRKGGQSINWGQLGAVGMASYDGPKKYMPPPVLNEGQKEAKQAWLRTYPLHRDIESKPITDSYGFKVADGAIIMDVAIGRRLYSPEPAPFREPKHWPSGSMPAFKPTSERAVQHDILQCMVSRWQAFGGVITECKPGKRERWMRA